MVAKVTADTIFEVHQDRLQLTWIAGHTGRTRIVSKDDDQEQSRQSLIGHLNAIHPNQIQVLGRWEQKYLESLGKNSYHDVIQQIFDNQPAAIIVTDSLKIDETIIKQANKTNTPLIASTTASQKLVNRIQFYLEHTLAETTILHGVFMEVHGLGVLLSGQSGIGKSEVALELINRGHRLIADDAPEFSRIEPDSVRGSCPEALRNFLEVRGLGILNIREMYGDSAIKPSTNLRLIVHLSLMTEEQIHKIDRLQGSYQNISLLDVEIPKVILPVGPGRNLAVLIEAATSQYIQLLSGYNAAEDFIEKQRQLIESSNS